MSDLLEYDLIVIGGGSGGLVVASVAAQLGLKVALCEKHKMGGDCLNYGCIPSKSLLAAAKYAHFDQISSIFGVKLSKQIDFKKVIQHVENVIKAIEPNDSQERFEKMGVKIFRHAAKFTSKDTIKAGDHYLVAKKIVISTGSKPFIPPIKNIENVKYLTNETIFSLKNLPKKLVVIGGGPIGCEMAQSFQRLGSEVTILEALPVILGKDDHELSRILIKKLQQDGIKLYADCQINKVSEKNKIIKIECEYENKEMTIEADKLLIATGRRADIQTLGLSEANIEFSSAGIKVNSFLRTTNKSVYAIGDCAGPFQFTHMASYQASIFISRCLFGNFFAKTNYNIVPWVTYTDPELAHVGMTENMAREKYGRSLKISKFSFEDNDRAQAEHRTEGVVKLLATKSGKILGVTIVGKNAGELISFWSLAIAANIKLSKIAQLIIPYPTLSEVNKRIASEFYKDFVFGSFMKKFAKFIFKFT